MYMYASLATAFELNAKRSGKNSRWQPHLSSYKAMERKKPGKLLQNKRLTLLSAEGALLELSGCGVKGEDVSGSPRVTERHIRCYICRLIFLNQNYSVVFS